MTINTRVWRGAFGPVLLTGVLAVLAVVAVAPVVREGWLLAWLSLGLTAGYALSGSA
ncbi:MAG TPA: hypothetical protein VE155_13620 [Pseudonocardiaceae bacterium]|jgi:uncharacterized membrane protein YccC|nr:hypothetical protein [Pseudonocardiaceae bacterium]